MTPIEWQDWRLTRDPESSQALKESAKERLLQRYLPLVGMVVSRMASCRGGAVADRDDFFQSGFLGLVRAVELFEPSRGVQFPSYATARIRGSVLDSLRTLDWLPRSFRRDSLRPGAPAVPVRCELDANALVDGGAGPGEALESKEELARLRLALSRLPLRERRAVEATYLEGRTLSDLSQEMEVSESRVCQIRTRALSRVRQLLEA